MTGEFEKQLRGIALKEISGPLFLTEPCDAKNAGWECQRELGHEGPHRMQRGGWRDR